MTAVVGVLNKHAVAIAADSAVTIGNSNGKKIFNKANKVFTLSKYHPVGIMLYNSADLMGTPWETIIKMYRAQLEDRYFKSVESYKDDFVEYIKSKNYFTNQAIQLSYLYNFSFIILSQIISELTSKRPDLLNEPDDAKKKELLTLLENRFDELIVTWASTDIYDEFKDLDFAEFESFTKPTFDDLFNSIFTSNKVTPPPDLLTKITTTIYHLIRSTQYDQSFTGLIFTGFGNDEIYPSLLSIKVSLVFKKRLRFKSDTEKSATISPTNSGAVCPFAQTDVIDTILTGIDPNLDNIYIANFTKHLNKYNDEILHRIGDSNPVLTEQIRNLNANDIVDEFRKANNDLRVQRYINPLMNAVSSLSKDDLAEMAESLIYLTYLKRRITFAEESVGGPVDVAIISKGDGFVWIKRKHYFKPELNSQFFNNYFKR